MLDLLERNNLDTGASVGLSIRQTPGGTTLAVSRPYGQVTPGIVQSGGISAMGGTAPGSGNVEIYFFDGAHLNDSGVEVVVWSISSTAGGVAGGTWVMIGQDASGYWWLLSVDCGN